MPLEGNIEHYHNGVEYSKMVSYMLSKKMLKLGAVKVFPNGLASVQDGVEYMTKGQVKHNPPRWEISTTNPVYSL